MSKVKQFIIIAYSIVLLFVCVYVPWEAHAYEKPVTVPAGYNFIWEAPTYYVFRPDTSKAIGNASDYREGYSILNMPKPAKLVIAGIDMKRLFVEILAITAISVIFYFMEDYKEKHS